MIEVALSVQLSAPIGLGIVDYGKLQEMYASRYPVLAEQPPLPRALEAFGGEPEPSAEAAMQALVNPRAPVRLWFANNDTGGLVQVQSDRFAFNWRRPSDEATYPGFSWIQAQFERELQSFIEVVSHLGHQMPDGELCEVVYVNHIASGAGWTEHAEIDKLFPSLRMPTLPSIPGAKPENAEIQLRFSMVDSHDKPGRLHFKAFPATRNADGARILVASLFSRCRPSPGTSGMIQALRDGHDWIVLAFKDMTSAEMHRIWGLLDE